MYDFSSTPFYTLSNKDSTGIGVADLNGKSVNLECTDNIRHLLKRNTSFLYAFVNEAIQQPTALIEVPLQKSA